MKILIVIPARAGSKGIKNKNIKLLNGKSLITYGIETALSSSHNMRTIISTDSKEIAENLVAEISFIRPKKLSGDDISTIPVIRQAVKYFQDQDWNPDIVVSLQSTTPFTSVKSLDEGVDRLTYNKHIDSSVSISEISNPHPFRSYSLTKDQTIEPLTKYTTKSSYRAKIGL
jgi:CMP-N-acetylneuraminic acid synthetase